MRSALESVGGDLTSLTVDARDREAIANAIEGAVEAMGSIDVLVNNARYSQMGIFEEVSANAFEAQFATNLFGA